LKGSQGKKVTKVVEEVTEREEKEGGEEGKRVQKGHRNNILEYSSYPPSENNLEQLSKMYWILGSKSQLSIESKLLLYKTILKPIWTYGVQL